MGPQVPAGDLTRGKGKSKSKSKSKSKGNSENSVSYSTWDPPKR